MTSSPTESRAPTKFALLTYRNTENLGDEIQSLAARRLLPAVDLLADRDFLITARPPTPDLYGLILNGWFMHRPENWPPPEWLVPFPISLHLADPSIRVGKLDTSVADILLDARLVSYLQQWGPVGARDLSTLAQLEAAGVPSYFSGCLSLTLERDPGATRGDEVVLVDVPEEVVRAARASTRRDLVVVTHGRLTPSDSEERTRHAEQLLARYQRAHCVVTSRLHAALPSLAFETPVLLVRPEVTDGRFGGLEHLVRSCSVAEFVSGHARFDVDDPPANHLDYLRFRTSLEDAVVGFVESFQDGTYVAGRPASVGVREREGTLWSLLAAANREREELRAECDRLRKTVDSLTGEETARRPIDGDAP